MARSALSVATTSSAMVDFIMLSSAFSRLSCALSRTQ